jgi:formyl-CoA transferase/CoA:oxalate CoA-transferase
MTESPKPRPLEGVLVLDFSRAVAGPYCSMVLGDLGARVIKIEEPDGDETRRWGPPFHQGQSVYYLSLNRNKESVVLDLKTPHGQAIAHQLARKADVVLENFRPGVAARLGVGYERLSKENPRLIYASVSGFGQTGPEKDRPGYDLIVQALSGLMRLSAEPGGLPVKVAFPLADVFASSFASQGILSALYSREKTGLGRRIEISLLESLLAVMINLTGTSLIAGYEPQPSGVRQANIVPYQLFNTADDPIVVGVPNDRIWRRFCQALGHEHWADEERFRNNSTRNQNRFTLVPMIEEVMAGKTASEWLKCFDEFGVPAGPVAGVTETLQSEQIQARGFVVDVPHPELGTLKMAGNPMRMDGVTDGYRPPPALGEHTEAVLREFGIADAAG